MNSFYGVRQTELCELLSGVLLIYKTAHPKVCFLFVFVFLLVWIAAGHIILVGLRDYQDDKADLILKYMSDEARLLKAYGELPENTRLK
ncbi:putative translation initiation factor 1A (eIF-1A), RNA-binding domain, S1, IF1 type [Rosa chinensis]|uniref:Putative translation initiation factor 1A (eIF-1A), RNA-binding domain, S1, IF1 type n=1 Tax=Rosa chinensis TaxID=74649 RepID=A0A2P6QQX7_ROSCH|nr:putative translation initiation factor 1A (eIF-1A), RNA-binding domain, S1, IF1 type [Rosa chinensis]